MTKIKIAVIGAGVMGLCTTTKIKELLPEAEITIYAEKFSPETTSDLSTGYWEPHTYGDRDASKQQIFTWGKETYDKLIELSTSSEASDYGVQMVSTICLSDQVETKEPFWAKNVLIEKKLSDEEMNKLGFSKHAKSGFHFMSGIIDMKRYLAHLQAKLEHKGGVKFFQRHITSIDELIGMENRDNYNFVINCSQSSKSFAARDKPTHTIEAHVVTVEAPWIKTAIVYHNHQEGSTYILPSHDKVILSGRVLSQETTETVKGSGVDQILQRCYSLVPSLKNAKILTKQTHSWSAREGGVRLEMETKKLETEAGEEVKIIHNYGHGGSGITLSFGCANEVARMVLEHTKKK